MVWSTPQTFTTGETVTAAKLNANVKDNLAALNPDDTVNAASWSATIKGSIDDTLSFTVTGRQWRVGPLQFVWAHFVFTAAPTGAGTLFVDLPVAVSGLGENAIGSFRAIENSTSARRSGTVILPGSTTVRFGLPDAGFITDTAPWVWDTDDVLTFHAVYPVA